MIKQYNLFNERKAADMSAYFLLKEENRTMNYMKLIKLLYLSDKEHIKNHYFSISNDIMISLEHGPILSETLDLIRGEQQSKPNGWKSRIAKKKGYYVSVKKSITQEDLGKLSEADCRTMDSVWNRPGYIEKKGVRKRKKLGHMTEWELRDYTHDHKNCPEWKKPGTDENYKGKNYIPITVDDVCKAVGFSESRIEGFKEDLKDAQYLIDRSF